MSDRYARGVAVAGIVALAAVGCSFLLDFEECATDADCASTYAGAPACVEGVCNGAGDILGGPCVESLGPVQDAGTFNVGVLLPLSGPEEGFGRPLLDAIKLAYGDFEALSGIHGTAVGLVICDTVGDDAIALEAAAHLADAGVQAIIGPDYSSQTVDIAKNITVDRGIVLVTPSGTAASITNIDDDNLVWRTVPSDAIQGKAIAILTREIASDVLNKELSDTSVGVMTARGDTYAQGLRDVFVAAYEGDASALNAVDYPNAAAGEVADYTGAVATLVTNGAPEILVVLGASEAWDIAEAVDAVDPDKDIVFIFPDAPKNADRAAEAPAALQGRVWGTIPQATGDLGYAPYLIFQIKFLSAYNVAPDDLAFAANAFDAYYLVALGAASSGFTGREIAAGMTKLSKGEKIDPNQEGAQRALRLLADGGTVDFQGASGPVDLDDSGDLKGGNVSLWCFESDALAVRGVMLGADDRFTPQTCLPEVENNNAPDVGPDAGAAGDADM